MVLSFLIAVLSGALFFFYIQAVCEKVLRREFSRPYFEDVLKAMPLEYPSILAALSQGSSLEYSNACLALKCDFMTLAYVLKNGDRACSSLSRRERALFLYFRFLLFCLPIRNALNLHEQEAVLKLSTMLQFFANLVGERLTVTAVGSLLPNP